MMTTTQEELEQLVQQALQPETDAANRRQRAQILRRIIDRLEASPEEPGEEGDSFKQAIPVLIATFGAALIGAAAPKGSVLRYAGAVPGTIDLFAKAQERRDFNQLVIPLTAAAAG